MVWPDGKRSEYEIEKGRESYYGAVGGAESESGSKTFYYYMRGGIGKDKLDLIDSGGEAKQEQDYSVDRSSGAVWTG